jgi:hypothetical protein
MTRQHHCPVLPCRWFHRTVASPLTPEAPADLTRWTAETWANMSVRPATGLATAHVVNEHLVTHSPVEWMAEIARRDRRISSLEELCGRLAEAVQNAMSLTEAVHAVTTMRLPSRAEVESIREQLAGLAGTAACDG